MVQYTVYKLKNVKVAWRTDNNNWGSHYLLQCFNDDEIKATSCLSGHSMRMKNCLFFVNEASVWNIAVDQSQGPVVLMFGWFQPWLPYSPKDNGHPENLPLLWGLSHWCNGRLPAMQWILCACVCVCVCVNFRFIMVCIVHGWIR